MKHIVYQWAVVGAGPAGIAAVGKLLDSGIQPSAIIWLDPAFAVGDLGTLWHNVSSNTIVALFTKYLHAAQSFRYSEATIDFPFNQLPLDNTCTLNKIVQPLQWITDHLNQTVCCAKTMIHRIALSSRIWHLHSTDCTYHAKNVILATGAVPETLSYPSIDTLPMHVAIDKKRFSEVVQINNTYAVFGSSHSAILIIKNLVDFGVKKIINFYRSPCRYAIEMGDWTLFNNTGLKGHAAQWARQHIDGVLPDNLKRCIYSDANIAEMLPSCDKAIYAVGFKHRNSLAIDGFLDINYNPHHGIIAPGLFGLGIGYPEELSDPFGYSEQHVGLWKFMLYLNKVLPIWLKYHA